MKMDKDATDATIKRKLKRRGFNSQRIISYLKGWNQVKNN